MQKLFYDIILDKKYEDAYQLIKQNESEFYKFNDLDFKQIEKIINDCIINNKLDLLKIVHKNYNNYHVYDYNFPPRFFNTLTNLSYYHNQPEIFKYYVNTYLDTININEILNKLCGMPYREECFKYLANKIELDTKYYHSSIELMFHYNNLKMVDYIFNNHIKIIHTILRNKYVAVNLFKNEINQKKELIRKFYINILTTHLCNNYTIEINNDKIVRLIKHDIQLDDNDLYKYTDNELECEICMNEEENEYIYLGCNHYFCKSCIKQINKKGVVKCPMCLNNSIEESFKFVKKMKNQNLIN